MLVRHESAKSGADGPDHAPPRWPAAPITLPLPERDAVRTAPDPFAAGSIRATRSGSPRAPAQIHPAVAPAISIRIPRDVTPPVERLKRLAFAVLPDDSGARHPVRALRVNQMADHI